MTCRPRARHRWAVRRARALRGASWTLWSLALARYRLRNAGLGARVAAPRWATDDDGAGLRYVLARTGATCLERALVLQSWSVAQGHPSDVIIGVGAGDHSIAAHAWLDGADTSDTSDTDYIEIHRLAP